MENVNSCTPTFACDLEEFKRRVARFAQAAPTLNRDELENGFKAVSLSYLGLTDTPINRILSVGLLEWAAKKYHERDWALTIAKVAA